MNLDRLENIARQRIKALFFSKFPSKGVENDVENFEADMSRLHRFKRRLGQHANLMKARALTVENKEKGVGILRSVRVALDKGHRLLAIDTENWQGGLQEVGLTVYEKGEIKSYNLRVMGEGVPPRGDYYHYGESEQLSLAEVIARTRAEARNAKFYVGHSIGNDIKLLSAYAFDLPKVPLLDTFLLHLMLTEENVSLSGLAAIHGIETPRPHSGGNDARYNMEVLLALVEANA